MLFLSRAYNNYITAWNEFSWFFWIPLFKFLWLLTTPISLVSRSSYQNANERLIEYLNRLVAPRSQHLINVREASKDLETFWRTFDGQPQDIALYAQALENPQWFQGVSILDVGCGVGRKSYELAKAGASEVLGVDNSKRNISIAKKMSPALLGLSFRDVEVADLQKEYANHFDYIISFTVFEHVDDVVGLLGELFTLQKPGGRNIIVYNHYLDRYGSHLKEFIYFPWPQLIWPEKILFSYWNAQLRKAQEKGGMGYFPKYYKHGTDGHNNDCFMNLNRHTIQQVESLIARTPYKLAREYRYSSSPLFKRWPWMRKTFLNKYLEGSIAYVLERPI